MTKDIILAGVEGNSIVDGPGIRYVIFTQGCPHHCKGCHNPGTHDISDGVPFSVGNIIHDMLAAPLITGITLSGGDPFVQPEACAEIARAAKERGLSVWAYTGWTFEELLVTPSAMQLLEKIDVLVDGPFDETKKTMECIWRGSSNQRLIDVQASLRDGKTILHDPAQDD